MERTLAIILFVLLLVGLGHIYHNSSLKEGARGERGCRPLDRDLKYRNYSALKEKILLHIAGEVKAGNMTRDQAQAHKSAENMIHVYKQALQDLRNRRPNSARFNQGTMGNRERDFIQKLANSLNARKETRK